MRYPASEKLEIIKLVERSHLPARRTLDRLGIARRTFYRWYDRYLDGGPEALADRPSAPGRVWNRIPDTIQDQIIEMALEQSELSPRELAVRFTDEKRYFVSEASVYRLLKAHDLITSPAFVVIKAARRVPYQDDSAERDVADRLYLLQDHRLGLGLPVDRTRRPLPLHHRLEAVQHDAGRGRIRLDMALRASGCDSATVRHKPKLLSEFERSEIDPMDRFPRRTAPAISLPSWPNGSTPTA
jgi:transposase-like protein